MSKKNKSSLSQKLLAALVVGAAAGSITSLLISSPQGKELRDYFWAKWKTSRFRVKDTKPATRNKRSAK